jgi:hypothetical protein
MVTEQYQPNARENLMIIANQRIEIPEQVGVKWNAKRALTHHAEAAERQNGVQV